MSFHVYFDKQVHKKLEKNKQAKKIKSLNFAESNVHQKTNARGSFETYNLFFEPHNAATHSPLCNRHGMLQSRNALIARSKPT